MAHSASTNNCELQWQCGLGADMCDSQTLNEIMPMIYKRFTEKSAEEWRQIYKVSSNRPEIHRGYVN